MAHRPAAAVVRFSSLGDVLLAAHVPDFLREQDPGRRVLFVTKERFLGVLRGHRSIDRLYALEERSSGAPPSECVRGGLGDLVAAVRHEGVDTVIDLHRNWRSSRFAGAFRGARKVLPPKYGLRRRAMVYARWLRPPPVPPLLATYRSMLGLGPGPVRPWLRDALASGELDRGAERAGMREHAAGFALLVAGARWETKRWPADRFVRLAEMIERSLPIRALLAAAPGERAEAELERLLPAARRGTLFVLPFRELAALAAHARAIVSNDSAALHLGPALGVPAVGIFGGTVPEFGFARQTARDEVAEIALGCRPCSVHGLGRCPLGHHACMRRLEPEGVLSLLERALERAPAAAAAGSAPA